MSSFRGYKTASQGAETPVWLATAPFDDGQNPNGLFFQERKEFQW